MDEAEGIYRGEVYAIMGALADVNVKLDRLLDMLLGGGDEEEEEG